MPPSSSSVVLILLPGIYYHTVSCSIPGTVELLHRTVDEGLKHPVSSKQRPATVPLPRFIATRPLLFLQIQERILALSWCDSVHYLALGPFWLQTPTAKPIDALVATCQNVLCVLPSFCLSHPSLPYPTRAMCNTRSPTLPSSFC